MPFQIGYLEVANDNKSFKLLASKTYPVAATWVLLAGVTYAVLANDPAIGKRLVVRLGGKADGGETDIWFDNLSVTVVSK